MALRNAIRRVYDESKIVTPAYRRWLRQTGGNVTHEPWVAKLIEAELTKQQRVRSGTFSGSSAGSCLRAQEFAYLGIDPPLEGKPSTDLLSIFDDGRWRHLRWQANLLSAGILAGIEMPLWWPDKRSAGSMDGYGVVPMDHPNKRWRGLEFGFELKGVNGFQYARLVKGSNPRPVDKHEEQVYRYMLVSGFQLFVIFYECKATQQTYEWVIEWDDKRVRDSLRELNDLNYAVDNQTLHPQLMSCSKRMGPSWEGCPYAGRGGICEQWRDKGLNWK